MTPIALINSILSIKFGTAIVLAPEAHVVMHPTDLFNYAKFKKDNPTKTIADYVPMYEPIEIRSHNKVFSHIIKDSVDVSNTFYLQFETDTDLNTSTQVLGSPSSRNVPLNGVDGTIRRRIIIDYKSIDDVSYVKVHQG